VNVFKMFENRVSSIFDASAAGYDAPFSFKKLAKKAIKEMESETFVVDGVDTAPGLYTILVSDKDDAEMRPLYGDIAAELSQLLVTHAVEKDYVFVGDPVVRFIADAKLRSGKFAVFAENIDPATLSKLRDEEDAFLAGEKYDPAKPVSRPARAQAIRPATSQTPIAPTPLQSGAGGKLIPINEPVVPLPDEDDDSYDPIAGLDVIPASVMDSLAAQQPIEPAAPVAPVSVAPVANAIPAAAQAAEEIPSVPRTILRDQPAAAPIPAVATPVASAYAAEERPASCLLIERQSGRTFTAQAPSAIIGRERATADIVLTDPNVSRRHAELTYDNGIWRVTDLGSTNGTLVNDYDVDSCALKNGDVLTIGLVNLEFREN